MLIKQIMSEPVCIDGRRFVENKSKHLFKGKEVLINTMYMDDKPILKEYLIKEEWGFRKFLKHLRRGTTVVQDLDKNLNIIA